MDNTLQMQKVLEAFRSGIPPDEGIKHITVGRADEINRLHQQLKNPEAGALFVQASYGTGKSHLLRYIREIALEEGFVVSTLTLDMKSGVAFNKLDQVLGEINRRLEIPTYRGHRSVRYLLDYARDKYNLAPDIKNSFWNKISNEFKWDYDHSGQFKSAALYAALRGWFFGDARTQDNIEDWLFRPSLYTSQKNKLYSLMFAGLRSHFRDLRSESLISTTGVFDLFKGGDYQKCWDMMSDLNTLARACGFRGLILLIDEFEDVISNISKQLDQQDAFWRLFEFFSGSKFTGLCFFAVTPDFVDKCKSLLIKSNVFDFDYSHFDSLPTFRLSSLESDDLALLVKLIANYHQIVYSWTVNEEDISIFLSARKYVGADTIRLLLKDTVNFLDRKLDEQDVI